MARIARACVTLVLVIVGLSIVGCIHTWTQTYDDFPPDAIGRPHEQQGNPTDG